MAWKRDDSPIPQPEPIAPQAPRPIAAPSSPSVEAPRRTERATIGPSIYIKGDLAGEEDLVIEGRVEGKIDLKQHNVTIGKSGKVRADVFGKVVTVEGEVDGSVYAQEQAVVRQSGMVRGNISAPRVTLEDGSRFKGSIDMEPKDLNRMSAGGAGSAGSVGSTGRDNRREGVETGPKQTPLEGHVGASRPAGA